MQRGCHWNSLFPIFFFSRREEGYSGGSDLIVDARQTYLKQRWGTEKELILPSRFFSAFWLKSHQRPLPQLSFNDRFESGGQQHRGSTRDLTTWHYQKVFKVWLLKKDFNQKLNNVTLSAGLQSWTFETSFQMRNLKDEVEKGSFIFGGDWEFLI